MRRAMPASPASQRSRCVLAPLPPTRICGQKILGGKVSDWVGDAAYVSLDDAHHRIALHPSKSAGVLAIEYGVESIDQIMQAQYFLQVRKCASCTGRADARRRGKSSSPSPDRTVCCSPMSRRASA